MSLTRHRHATLYVRGADDDDAARQEVLAHRIADAAGFDAHRVVRAAGPLDDDGYGPGVATLLHELEGTEALVTVGLDRLTASVAAGRCILDAVNRAGIPLVVAGGTIDRQVAESVWAMVDPSTYGTKAMAGQPAVAGHASAQRSESA